MVSVASSITVQTAEDNYMSSVSSVIKFDANQIATRRSSETNKVTVGPWATDIQACELRVMRGPLYYQIKQTCL